MTADEMALLDAYAEGQRLGKLGSSVEMNPYAPDTPERAECERGRMNALAYRLCNLAGSVC